jgi:hypothetical protein
MQCESCGELLHGAEATCPECGAEVAPPPAEAPKPRPQAAQPTAAKRPSTNTIISHVAAVAVGVFIGAVLFGGPPRSATTDGDALRVTDRPSADRLARMRAAMGEGARPPKLDLGEAVDGESGAVPEMGMGMGMGGDMGMGMGTPKGMANPHAKGGPIPLDDLGEPR